MKAARIDANQPEIVKALRDMGCSVQHLHKVGQGCPDLLVGISGTNHLIEVKDGKKPPSERKLRPTQEKWHGEWLGRVQVVESIDDAVAYVNFVRKNLLLY